MNHLVNNGLKLIRANAPEIMTAIGIGGVVTTAVLAVKATLEAEKVLDAHGYDDFVKANPVRKYQREYRARLTWKCYIPPVASGVVTIGAIILSHKAGSRRTAAAVTAYSLTEKAFNEFKEKAAESIGEGKVRRIKDDIAQDHITAHPPSKQQILVVGSGNVLCYDRRSCQYFRSSMEEIKRAANDLNFQLNHERFMSLSEFYSLVGLPITRESVYMGWNLDRGLMDLDITATIAESDEPCLVIDFNYCDPLHDGPAPDSPICTW